MLKEVYKKYDGTLENPKLENSNSIIASINKSAGVWSRAHYCGTSLWYFCREAGFQLPISKTAAARARNWKEYGDVIWDRYNGWKKGVNQTPEWDEIFVLVFNWNGQNHVGVALEFHGGINFITGEGNTTGSKVRNKNNAVTNYVGKPRPDSIYIKNSKSEGIWMRKERYAGVGSGLVAVVKYKVL